MNTTTQDPFLKIQKSHEWWERSGWRATMVALHAVTSPESTFVFFAHLMRDEYGETHPRIRDFESKLGEYAHETCSRVCSLLLLKLHERWLRCWWARNLTEEELYKLLVSNRELLKEAVDVAEAMLY